MRKAQKRRDASAPKGRSEDESGVGQWPMVGYRLEMKRWLRTLFVTDALL